MVHAAGGWNALHRIVNTASKGKYAGDARLALFELVTGHGADPNARGMMRLQARSLKHADDEGLRVVHHIISKGVASEQVALLDCLIDHGLDVNLPTAKGETPLQSALRAGAFEVARHLLR
jgi:ankyrin repeat protein